MSANQRFSSDDTICAISTPPGTGAIAIVRIAGTHAINIVNTCFKPSGENKSLLSFAANQAHFGYFMKESDLIDEVVITLFKAPHSYSGEDIVEISCHGSEYIQQRILETLIEKGARLARAGEFTLRAFLHGKLDLSQAEAVADLISSQSKATHTLAIKQLRGGFSKKIKQLRGQLLDLVSLLELELDFSEEDVEFADRNHLKITMNELIGELSSLSASFAYGNVVKTGVPVAIIGKPNVGKSTLLNALLNEEKAIVSDIPGTTRDSIEDTFTSHGITFRFIDTAGLRTHTTDVIESIGISRTYEKIKEATVILYLFDISTITVEEVESLLKEFREHIDDPDKQFLLVGNKTDLMFEAPSHITDLFELETIFISAKRKENIHLIMEQLVKTVKQNQFGDQAVITNVRHYEAISHTLQALNQALEGFEQNIPTDLISIDIHQALHHLGEIIGEITTDDILGNIFGRFCIGK